MSVATTPPLSDRRKLRVEPRFGLAPGWWLVALASEVKPHHPGAFSLGNAKLAIYRDRQGTVRAVDDVCPHRRMPLSKGRITEDGHLQCGYHGWCFDGATGRCTSIPNLRDDEKVPGAIRVAAFSAVENLADIMGFGLRLQYAPAVGPPTGDEPDDHGMSMFDARVHGGLVLIWTGDEASRAEDLAPPRLQTADTRSFEGRIDVRAPHHRVAEALHFNPGRVLGLGPVLGSGDEVARADVSIVEGTVSARRERLTFDLPRIGTYDPFVDRVTTTWIATIASTGLTYVELERADGAVPLRLVAGVTPVTPWRTIVRFRGQVDDRAGLDAAVRILTAAPRRGSSRVEALADITHELVDEGIDGLRALRAAADTGGTE